MTKREIIFKQRDVRQNAQNACDENGLDIVVVRARVRYVTASDEQLDQPYVKLVIFNIWNSWKQRDEFKRIMHREFDGRASVYELGNDGQERSTQRLVSYCEA